MAALLATMCFSAVRARADDFAARARAEAAARLPAYPGPLADEPSSEAAALAIDRRLTLLETRERGLRAIGRPRRHKARQIGGWVGFGVCLAAAVIIPFAVTALTRDDPDVTSEEQRMERSAFAISGLSAVGAGAFLWLALTTPANPFREEIEELYLERRSLRHKLNEFRQARVALSLRGAGFALRF